jgi:signal transduction histidine kinase
VSSIFHLGQFTQIGKQLQTWINYPQQETVLLRKIVDRIRNSLELKVVLQTAVTEIAQLLELDACLFLWYFQDTQRVQVVCEHSPSSSYSSRLGYYPMESFGAMGGAIASGQIIINGEALSSNLASVSKIAAQLNKFQSKQHYSPEQVLGSSANLLIPVTDEVGWVGFIACLSEQPRSWTAGEIELLQSITHPLEIAIRQAQLYEQTQKQAQREQLVNQITSQTRQTFDLEIILTEAIAQLLEALQVDRCLVHLVENSETLEGGIHLTESPHLKAEAPLESKSPADLRRQHLYEVCRPPFPPTVDEFDTHGPITQWVVQHRQRVVIADVTQDKRIGSNNQEYQKAKIKSSLVIPAQANGKLHAILYLNQCSEIRYWSKNDQKLTQAVADQLAISIQQAYLYSQIQRQAAHSAAQAQKMTEMLTELKQTQAQLIHSEKMSSLGQMVAGVAHEINNPVNFIYGNIPYLENYVRDLVSLVKAYQQEYPYSSPRINTLAEEIDLEFLMRDLPQIFQSMQSGAERIHSIVDLLQNFSRQNEAPLKAVDLNGAIESTLLMLHNQHSGRILVERNWGELPLVECYAKEINQVFLHIITNAIEALRQSETPDKRIKITTELVQANNPEQNKVRVMIADNGPGIPQGIQLKVFDPFFTTKDVGQGKGLGLTVSYQTVVDQHQGTIEMQSTPGCGAEFILELPVKHQIVLPRERLVGLQ